MKQDIVTFHFQWDEKNKRYNQEAMLEQFFKHIGENKLYINQIIRWNDFEIIALVEKKDIDSEENLDVDLTGIEGLIPQPIIKE